MVKLMTDQYFRAAFKYEEIIALLERFHGVEVTLRNLHRMLMRDLNPVGVDVRRRRALRRRLVKVPTGYDI